MAVISPVFKYGRVEYRKAGLVGFRLFRRRHVRFIHISIEPRYVQIELAPRGVGDVPAEAKKGGDSKKKKHYKNP